ncbi:hypothetical protein [Altererythrobacter aquiaggeris]|uniref:hypothetical protein n=1 Tax=Aestuarierythrobacter aquiaggeris TaxID=1898396 RepID=UPI00301AD514
MKRSVPFFAVTAALALSACSGADDNEATDLDTANTKSEAEAIAASLQAGDFIDLQLGAKIVGPQGPEVEGALSNDAGNFADIRSYVACPAGMESCDRKTAPEGTVFTYVHVVYPGEDNQSDTGSGQANTSSDIEAATAFRMTMPAHGFTGAAGYSKAEAMSAIGAKADVVITCDKGAIVWTVSAGDGGNQWEQAEPLTFYWQSTLPPAGPSDAYAIHANYTTATGPGPYPAAKAGATNTCG